MSKKIKYPDNFIKSEKARVWLSRIGFNSVSQYQEWCVKHGFDSSVNKSESKFKAEYDYIKEHNALIDLKKSNQKVTLKRALELIKSGETFPGNNMYNTISNIYNDAAHAEYLYINKNEFFDVLLYLEQKSDLVIDSYIHSIAAFLSKKDYWVRSWNTWEPPSYNADKQAQSFVRHLFAKYPVPYFFDSVWLTQSDEKYNWFIHVAQGGNIVKAPGFTRHYPMTKKMAHYFMQAPNTYSIQEAWKYGQVVSMGGSVRLVQALKSTQVFRGTQGHSDYHSDFILSLIKFFIDNPMLDLAQVGPIVDYIWDQKFVRRRRVLIGGIAEVEPDQPNFSMTGRSVDTLMAQVDRWHRQLGKEKKGGDLSWDHWPVADFELVEGSAKNKNQKIWRITQLLTSKELSDEGRAMRHCVASYGHSCSRGTCSIWSMTLEQHTGEERRVTIELGKNPLRVYQVRGKNNRLIESAEKRILAMWIAKERISLG